MKIASIFHGAVTFGPDHWRCWLAGLRTRAVRRVPGLQSHVVQRLPHGTGHARHRTGTGAGQHQPRVSPQPRDGEPRSAPPLQRLLPPGIHPAAEPPGQSIWREFPFRNLICLEFNFQYPRKEHQNIIIKRLVHLQATILCTKFRSLVHCFKINL